MTVAHAPKNDVPVTFDVHDAVMFPGRYVWGYAVHSFVHPTHAQPRLDVFPPPPPSTSPHSLGRPRFLPYRRFPRVPMMPPSRLPPPPALSRSPPPMTRPAVVPLVPSMRSSGYPPQRSPSRLPSASPPVRPSVPSSDVPASKLLGSTLLPRCGQCGGFVPL